MKTKTIENKLKEELLKAMKDKEQYKIVKDKYTKYSDHILSSTEYEFYHIPKSFSKITDMFVKYKREVNQDGK